MTKFMQNIFEEPKKLAASLNYTFGPGKAALAEASKILKKADHIYITGIGSSWYAGMAILAVFNANGRVSVLTEASELLHFTDIPKNSALILLSRSGKSIEIVNLLSRAKKAKAKVIGITNMPDSPLGKKADAVLRLETTLDHNVSVSMYTGLILVGSILAESASGTLKSSLAKTLAKSLSDLQGSLSIWKNQIQGHPWFSPNQPVYFLARAGSLASCHEARLLWEEGAKAPATAMPTSNFRHGPLEVIAPDLRIGIWIDGKRMRNEDLALARDLRTRGVRVMVIGQNIPQDAGDLVFQLPAIPAEWQFVIDIAPVQLAAEYLSHLRGKDCDSFAECQYIVEDEGGLAPKKSVAARSVIAPLPARV